MHTPWLTTCLAGHWHPPRAATPTRSRESSPSTPYLQPCFLFPLGLSCTFLPCPPSSFFLVSFFSTSLSFPFTLSCTQGGSVGTWWLPQATSDLFQGKVSHLLHRFLNHLTCIKLCPNFCLILTFPECHWWGFWGAVLSTPIYLWVLFSPQMILHCGDF